MKRSPWFDDVHLLKLSKNEFLDYLKDARLPWKVNEYSLKSEHVDSINLENRVKVYFDPEGDVNTVSAIMGSFPGPKLNWVCTFKVKLMSCASPFRIRYKYLLRGTVVECSFNH